ncbi:hypothetical protein FACS189499_06970 [Clostridia bacterium]|nr:hypothetical protein FACS189499_06970 [Clostridia bacterium]
MTYRFDTPSAMEEAFGNNTSGKEPESFGKLRTTIIGRAEQVVGLLASKNKKISIAESCTGGMITSAIVGVSDASKVIDLGICTYSPEMKSQILGVKPETIESHGVVSDVVATEMALGVMKLSGADIAVSTTGVAGPDGGTPRTPVGMVYYSIITRSGFSQTRWLSVKSASIYAWQKREYVRLFSTNEILVILESLLLNAVI